MVKEGRDGGAVASRIQYDKAAALGFLQPARLPFVKVFSTGGFRLFKSLDKLPQ